MKLIKKNMGLDKSKEQREACCTEQVRDGSFKSRANYGPALLNCSDMVVIIVIPHHRVLPVATHGGRRYDTSNIYVAWRWVESVLSQNSMTNELF